MLLKLCVENFKSFNEMVEFSMIESNKYRDKTDHKIKIKNVNVLKHAVIYGANASGKSNLIEVFEFIRFCLLNRIPFSTQNSFCKILEENRHRPSKFEIHFSIKEKIYAYGFSAVLSNCHILEEWLYELTSSANANMIFERRYGEEIEFGKTLKCDADEESRLKTYSRDFIQNKNCLFLSEMNRNKKFGDGSPLKIFNEVFTWLTQSIIVMTPNSWTTDFAYFDEGTTIEKVSKIISAFDTGISEAQFVEISLDEMKKKVPEEVFNSMMDDINESTKDGELKPFKVSLRSDCDFFVINFKSIDDYTIKTLSLKHGKSFFDFSFEEESDGTRRLFDMLDMLLLKREDVVFVVDELERSLHPKLTQMFLTLFSNIHTEIKTQLIFTTHESSIMDLELFRRDEFWFIERSEENASSVYSLDMFKERYDKKLRKAYLEGRYGAIPIFQNFNFED